MGLNNKFYIKSIIIGSILALLFTLIELPYYITRPGLAQELEPIIHVDGGFESEGSFSLTTVRMGKANIFTYLFAKFQKYYAIYPIKEIRSEGESDEEYTIHQLHLMERSKEAAVYVAYQYANKQVEAKSNGIYVVKVVDDMPAHKELKAGDRIIKVDGIKQETVEQFIEYVSDKQEGDRLELVYEREGKENTSTIKIGKFPNQDKIGLGISLTTDLEIITDPTVIINSEKIGGPSAGLMFTLEIYNQLVEKDITNGYKIAGTGTINSKGEVGPIGGISQKIVAASNSGVNIFFAPNEHGSQTSDYQEALKTAKEIETEMHIVPVDTFKDALDYLEALSN